MESIDANTVAAWAVFGLIAGALAKILMPGRDKGGLLTTAGLGIAGAVLGNVIYYKTTQEPFSPEAQLSLFGFVLSVAGGLCLLFARRVMFGAAG